VADLFVVIEKEDRKVSRVEFSDGGMLAFSENDELVAKTCKECMASYLIESAGPAIKVETHPESKCMTGICREDHAEVALERFGQFGLAGLASHRLPGLEDHLVQRVLGDDLDAELPGFLILLARPWPHGLRGPVRVRDEEVGKGKVQGLNL